MSNKATDTKPTETKQTTPVVARRSLVPALLVLGTDMAERGVITSFDLANDVRAELKSVTDATIGYADSIMKTTLDLVRSITSRVDQLASASLDQGKATALDLVSAARASSTRATELTAEAWI